MTPTSYVPSGPTLKRSSTPSTATLAMCATVTTVTVNLLNSGPTTLSTLCSEEVRVLFTTDVLQFVSVHLEVR